MIPLGIATANATQSLLGAHGFASSRGELETCSIIGGSDDGALPPTDGHGLLWMEGSLALQLLNKSQELLLLHCFPISRNRHRERPDEHHLTTLLGNRQQTSQGRCWHKANIRHDDGGVTTSHIIGKKVSIGHIIDIVTALDNGLHSLNEFRCTFLHRVDVKKGNGARLVVEHIIIWQINKHIVVGVSPLEEGLATLNVAREGRHSCPPVVIGCHVHAGIETPPRPLCILGRIARTMEKDMVHT